MEKPRLILCSLAFGGGGAENQVWRFASALREQFEILVLTGYPPSDQAPPDGVRVECVGGDTRWTRLDAARRIGEICMERRPDLVWSHYMTYSISLARARRRGVLRCPLVIEEVVELSPSLTGTTGAVFAWLARRYYRHADRVLGYSGETIVDLRRNFHVAAERSQYLPCIGPEPRPRPPRAEASQDDPVRLLAAGRMVAQKGFDLLLKSYADVRRTASTPSRLTILGDGPLRAELEAQAQDLGLGEHVRFPGAVKFAVYEEEMQNADVFVLSSRFEGMANVLLEAMGFGVPIVSTRVSGVRDLFADEGEADGEKIREARGALIVPLEDRKTLGEALVRLIDDGEGRVRSAEASARRSAEFRPENVAPAYARLFGELIDG